MHSSCFFFFFNDTATTEIYTLSLHDALPISSRSRRWCHLPECLRATARLVSAGHSETKRSEEHTSELQSRQYLVCRLLLEKKKDAIETKASVRLALDGAFLRVAEAIMAGRTT